MRIAFNALSVNNLSGRHVLLGHMRGIIDNSAVHDRHVLLYHAGNHDLCTSLGDLVDMVECPAYTAHWAGRSIWERFWLPALLKRVGAQLLFSPAGVTAKKVRQPQIALAQNPWCFVSGARSGVAEELKAALQRHAYRHAQRSAALMLFNSEYMSRVYRANAGFGPVDSLILHQGLDEETFAAAREIPGFDQRRSEILVVSAMGRHKSIEDVVDALALLRGRGIEVRMKLVGPWPDLAYRAQVERRVKEADLAEAVDFIGYVTRDDLHRHYAEARVFCLLSRCESFGIPAVEAEVFGTPAVVADCCAPPEIAGPGGVVVPPGDPVAAADALAMLLTDASAWSRCSERARANAERFHWASCTRPLVDWLHAMTK